MRYWKKTLCAALAAMMILAGTSCDVLTEPTPSESTTEQIPDETVPDDRNPDETEPAEITPAETDSEETTEEVTTEEVTTEEVTTEAETAEESIPAETETEREEIIEDIYSKGLEYVSNGDGTCTVKGIGNCTDKNISIPRTYNGMTVTNIDANAFSRNQELSSVAIPAGVTYTSIWPFAYCANLISITVDPSNPNFCSIDGVLYDKNISTLICCPGGKTEISIPDSVTEIYYGAFAGCEKLKYISLPANLIDIGNYAFEGCSNLTTLTIPDKVTWVGTGVFSGCDKLVVEENGVRYVDKWVVDCDTSVTDVVLRKNTKGIAFEAFTYCHNLKTISIPSGVSDVTKHMFSDSSQVFVKDKGIIYVDKWVVNSDQTVSEIVLRDDTVGIGSHAFSHNDKIVSVVIPDSVMHIGPEAFYGCEKLTFIKIGNGVTSIGSYAFSGCWNLSSVVIGSNVTSIGDWAFSNCHDLTSINIPDSVTSIGEGAFCNCRGLTSITIPAGVTEIKEGAFLGCDLTEIRINEGNQYYTVYDDMLFTKDMSVLIWCSHRKNTVAVPDGVTRIGNYAFFAMRNLTSVTLPDSVTSMGHSAFDNCHNLTSVIIPDGVTSIGDSSFNWCETMTSIIIPNGVTSIGERAFSNCIKLTSAVISSSVTNIDRSAFVDCSSLTDIYFTGTESEWNAITKGSDWDSDTGPYTLHFNYVP